MSPRDESGRESADAESECAPPIKRRTPQSDLGTSLREEFGGNVRHFRRLRGMTQQDLAKAAGLGRSFISQLESGRFSATLETIGALSTALGVSPSKLIRSSD